MYTVYCNYFKINWTVFSSFLLNERQLHRHARQALWNSTGKKIPRKLRCILEVNIPEEMRYYIPRSKHEITWSKYEILQTKTIRFSIIRQPPSAFVNKQAFSYRHLQPARQNSMCYYQRPLLYISRSAFRSIVSFGSARFTRTFISRTRCAVFPPPLCWYLLDMYHTFAQNCFIIFYYF